MKHHWLTFLLCGSLMAHEAEIFRTQNQLEKYISDSELFYEFYLAEQKDIDASVNLSEPARRQIVLNPPALPNPPADPPAPTSVPMMGTYLHFVIVNDSNIPDNQVYISIIGAQVIGTTAQTQKMYVTFDPMGVGSYVNIAGNGSVTPVPLSTINTAQAPHTYAFYIPANNNGSDGISGARIYVQMNDSTPLITYTGGVVTEPSVLNQSLASYNIVFDKYEFAYIPMGSPQVAADGTAVDFFSIPLYGYLSTPDATSPSHSGLFASQSFIMQNAVPYFFNAICSNAAILGQWNNLFSPNTASPIRVLSPASAMSVGTSSSFPNKFDPNYFDNEAAYGFSLIKFLWSGTSAYYKNNPLNFAIPASMLYPQPAGGVYTASIDGSNQMNFSPAFTTEGQSYFPAPSTANATAPSPTNGPTSYLIAASQNLNSSFAANLQGNQVSKLFEEALMVGLLPAPFPSGSPLSNPYFTANTANYYNNSGRLPATAGGPWYSVYSQALHYCGPIYTFGFDEPLYPNVLMQCTTPSPATYIGITIGLCDLTP